MTRSISITHVDQDGDELHIMPADDYPHTVRLQVNDTNDSVYLSRDGFKALVRHVADMLGINPQAI